MPRHAIALWMVIAGCDAAATETARAEPVPVPAPAPPAPPAQAPTTPPPAVAATPPQPITPTSALPPIVVPDVEEPTFDGMTARLALTVHETAGSDAAVWSSRAWAAYRAKDYAGARPWFALLARGEPTVWKHAHNLACASVMAGESADAGLAIAESIRRGGKQARAKIDHETDFAGVRDQPWFAAVLASKDEDDDEDDDDAPKMPAKTRTVTLTAGTAVVPSPGIVIPPTFADGLTAIAGPFDPFRDLLRVTPEVSRGKRTAYRKRKPNDEFDSEVVPDWTIVHGRRDLDKPQWWQPHAGNIYLIVPYSLPGYDSVFGAPILIDGFALYSLVDDELRLVQTDELDQRDFRCGDESAIWALFFDSEATALYEVLGCTNAGEPDACITRVEEDELRRTCTLAMPEALASR